MTAPEDLHTIPTTDRPPQGFSLRGLAFIAIFNIGCLCVNGSQLLLMPLALVAPWLYRAMIRKTKASFGLLLGAFITALGGMLKLTIFGAVGNGRMYWALGLVLMCQWFAPTSLVVTCEGDNGVEEVVVRDEQGRVTELRLPPQVVMMPNHQVGRGCLFLNS
jgi:hypothetical protein